MAATDPSALQAEIIERIGAADSLDALDAIRVDALGKKGSISLAMRELGQLEGEARREADRR